MRLSRAGGIAVKGLVIGATVAGSLALAAAPANALGGCAISSGVPFTALTGVPTPVSVTTCNGETQMIATFANNVTQSVSIGFTASNVGTASWVPQQAGPATLSLATNTGASTGVLNSATVSQTPTVTVVSAPNTATTGQPTVINVLVTAAGTSNYVPTGSVRLNTGFGVNITTMGLTPSFSGGVLNPQAPPGATVNSSFAFYRWTPPSNGTYTFQSVYSGDANALTSTSVVDTLLATPSGGTIALNAPNTATVGVPISISATVFPTTSTGSVGFTLNGQPISASVPLVNGVATYTWTPTVAGNSNLGANYMTNDGRSGSAQAQPIAISAGPVQTDSITLVQPGFGPWSPNGVYTLGNGTTFAFQASTLSGAPVTLTETGPCNLNGLTLVIDTGSGQCNLMATSAGGPGYAPVKFGYTILMAPGTQTASLAAPRTGTTIQRGRTVRLENPTQGQTSAGQQINWTVLKNSRNICRLRFLSSGAVNLQVQRPGQCNVRATAPAVPNSWNAFRLDLRYRVS